MMQIQTMNQILTTIQIWIEVSNQRKALRELTDQQLADIGLSREEAAKEASKSFRQTARPSSDANRLRTGQKISQKEVTV